MGGSLKSKRVSWASDVNLCQVRLFSSEESPSLVGMRAEGHHPTKAFCLVRSGVMGSNDNLAPGLEEINTTNPWRTKLSQIPFMKWKCPPRFEVHSAWQVVAGEESKEREIQNQREMRVLEAIYPRLSSIPSNPSAPVGVKYSSNSDHVPRLVPITPIEDEDPAMDASTGSSVANSNPLLSATVNCKGDGISATSVEPDIVAAAQTALTSIMSRSNQGNLIDAQLLIKILSDPKTIEQLVTNHVAASSAQNVPSSSSTHNIPSSSTVHSTPVIGARTVVSCGAQHAPSSNLQSTQAIGMQKCASSGATSMHNNAQSSPGIGTHNLASSSTASMHNMPSTSMQYSPNLRSPPKSSPDPVNVAINRRDPLSTNAARPELGALSRATATGPVYPPSRVGSFANMRPPASDVVSAASPSAGAPTTKDINYYKSLIQQHGGEKRETAPQYAHQSNHPSSGTGQNPLNITKPRESKPRIMKPCIYFNTLKGCRNGANCAYQHVSSTQRSFSSIPEVQSTKRVKLDREITGT